MWVSYMYYWSVDYATGFFKVNGWMILYFMIFCPIFVSIFISFPHFPFISLQFVTIAYDIRCRILVSITLMLDIGSCKNLSRISDNFAKKYWPVHLLHSWSYRLGAVQVITNGSCFHENQGSYLHILMEGNFILINISCVYIIPTSRKFMVAL